MTVGRQVTDEREPDRSRRRMRPVERRLRVRALHVVGAGLPGEHLVVVRRQIGRDGLVGWRRGDLRRQELRRASAQQQGHCCDSGHEKHPRRSLAARCECRSHWFTVLTVLWNQCIRCCGDEHGLECERWRHVAVNSAARIRNGIHCRQCFGGCRSHARSNKLGRDAEVDGLDGRAELQEKDVAVERQQVDHDAIEAVAKAPGRPALLVFLETLELSPQRRRDRSACLDAE